MIFLNDTDVMLDANVRKAAAHAIDKQMIIDRLLSGYGVKIDTLQTPQYEAYDASITVPYNPDEAVKLLAASGFGPDKPVKFKIQTTKGFKPKDYEMIQAIVGMWRKVGIEAEIEVYEIAKHYELRAADQLTPAPSTTGATRWAIPRPRPASRCSGPRRTRCGTARNLVDMIGPLWGEQDEAKRIAGWKAVDKYIAENALVIPAAAICAADPPCAGRQGHAACFGRSLAASDEARLTDREPPGHPAAPPHPCSCSERSSCGSRRPR